VPIPYFEVHGRAPGASTFRSASTSRTTRTPGATTPARSTPCRTFDGDGDGRRRRAGRLGRGHAHGREAGTRQRRSDAAVLHRRAAPGRRLPLRLVAPEDVGAGVHALRGGHITYIRTDSTRLAASPCEGAGGGDGAYGEDHLGRARAKATRARRRTPTRPSGRRASRWRSPHGRRRRPSPLPPHPRQTLASQMAPSERTVSARGAARGSTGPHRLRVVAHVRRVGGRVREFLGDVDRAARRRPGHGRRVDARPGDDERRNPLLIEDATKPPPRYRPHTLIKAMKDAGIGRPSTYSRTVEKLEERKYVTSRTARWCPRNGAARSGRGGAALRSPARGRC
jgi:hypothetical protein